MTSWPVCGHVPELSVPVATELLREVVSHLEAAARWLRH